MFCFFFQAEDGIRDLTVTGVQTCALPISGDLGELAHRMRTTLFEVVEGQTVIYRTAGWPPAGRTPYRIRTAADATHRVTVARDETPLRQTLWTLAVILATGIPCAIGLASGGGD